MNRLTLIANQLSATNNNDLLDQQYPEKALDEYMSLGIRYRADPSKEKYYFNGAYNKRDGTQHYFTTVSKAEKFISKSISYDPLPPEGYSPFNEAVKKLVFHHCPDLIKDNKIACIQTVSCTEALRIGLEFVKKFIPGKIYVSYPTYGNHITILESLQLQYSEYNYMNEKKDEINWKGIKYMLRTAEPGSIIFLQACCHNPTGFDPTIYQWRKIAAIIKKQNLIPFWDASFLGFQSGDPFQDAEVFKIFSDLEIQMIVCVSFSKIMGIYGERVGALLISCANEYTKAKVQSQMNNLMTGFHEHAQVYGGAIVEKVLSDPILCKQWRAEIRETFNYFAELRKLLVKKLNEKNQKRNWDVILKHRGMFTLLPLTSNINRIYNNQENECLELINVHKVYLISIGRIAIGCLNPQLIEILVDRVDKVINKA